MKNTLIVALLAVGVATVAQAAEPNQSTKECPPGTSPTPTIVYVNDTAHLPPGLAWVALDPAITTIAKPVGIRPVQVMKCASDSGKTDGNQ